jgi:hypothetical protein
MVSVSLVTVSGFLTEGVPDGSVEGSENSMIRLGDVW